MDEEVDRLVLSVRADTSGIARDLAEIRGGLEGSLTTSAEIAGRGIEHALLRAVRTGKFGFEDLKKVALSVLADIAANAVRGGLNALFGGNGGLSGAIGSLFGAPGRATGGPVSPGRAYLVGERGPELFVPASSGRIDANASDLRSGGRDVRVSITINAGAGEAAGVLAQSSRQVARAVRAAIESAGG